MFCVLQVPPEPRPVRSCLSLINPIFPPFQKGPCMHMDVLLEMRTRNRFPHSIPINLHPASEPLLAVFLRLFCTSSLFLRRSRVAHWHLCWAFLRALGSVLSSSVPQTCFPVFQSYKVHFPPFYVSGFVPHPIIIFFFGAYVYYFLTYKPPLP